MFVSSSALGDLAEGRYDALIATAAAGSDDRRAAPLAAWPWAVYARAGHPAFDDWSLTAWSTYPHLQVRTSVLEGRGPAAYNLDNRELPFDLAPMGLSLLRNAAEGNEPGVRWFLERMTAAFGDPKNRQ